MRMRSEAYLVFAAAFALLASPGCALAPGCAVARPALRALAARSPRAAVRAAADGAWAEQLTSAAGQLTSAAEQLKASAAELTSDALRGLPQMPVLPQMPEWTPQMRGVLPQMPLWTPPEESGIFSSSVFTQLYPAFVGAGAALLVSGFLLLLLQEPKLDKVYANGKYDPRDAEAFFAERPGAILFRTLDLFRLGLRFGVQLLLDWRFGRIDKNQPKRAKELTRLLTDCGATFIKIGQALSIRTDLLSPAYIASLSELQDRVPAFSNAQAFEMIRAELGLPKKSATDNPFELPECFSELSAKPVAAASLGQVYRARLRESGVEVAVKVQRPGVLEAVALDMHLIRMTAALVIIY
jgi:hypothetical protein